MNRWQLALWLFVIAERLFELWLARRNAVWSKAHGGYEVGRGHYPLFILLHTVFLCGIYGEAQAAPDWWLLPFTLFLAAQILRIWAIASLGRRWNTRIWIIPQLPPIRRGPYRYVRHPNYLVVVIELLTLPLLYQAYATMVIISLLNAVLLWKIRIPAEERALQLR
jgi:methyltransferase